MNAQTEPPPVQTNLLGASVTETTFHLLFRLQGTNIAQNSFTINGVEIWDLTTATLLLSAYEGVDEFVWDAYPVSNDEIWVWIEAEGVPTYPFPKILTSLSLLAVFPLTPNPFGFLSSQPLILGLKLRPTFHPFSSLT